MIKKKEEGKLVWRESYYILIIGCKWLFHALYPIFVYYTKGFVSCCVNRKGMLRYKCNIINEKLWMCLDAILIDPRESFCSTWRNFCFPLVYDLVSRSQEIKPVTFRSVFPLNLEQVAIFRPTNPFFLRFAFLDRQFPYNLTT